MPYLIVGLLIIAFIAMNPILLVPIFGIPLWIVLHKRNKRKRAEREAEAAVESARRTRESDELYVLLKNIYSRGQELMKARWDRESLRHDWTEFQKSQQPIELPSNEKLNRAAGSELHLKMTVTNVDENAVIYLSKSVVGAGSYQMSVATNSQSAQKIEKNQKLDVHCRVKSFSGRKLRYYQFDDHRLYEELEILVDGLTIDGIDVAFSTEKIICNFNNI